MQLEWPRPTYRVRAHLSRTAKTYQVLDRTRLGLVQERGPGELSASRYARARITW